MKKLLLLLLCLPIVCYSIDESSVLKYLYKSLNGQKTNDIIIEIDEERVKEILNVNNLDWFFMESFVRGCGGLGGCDFSIHKESNILIIENHYDGDWESSSVLDIMLFKLDLDYNGELFAIDTNTTLYFQFNERTHLIENDLVFGRTWLFAENINICWDESKIEDVILSEDSGFLLKERVIYDDNSKETNLFDRLLKVGFFQWLENSRREF